MFSFFLYFLSQDSLTSDGHEPKLNPPGMKEKKLTLRSDWSVNTKAVVEIKPHSVELSHSLRTEGKLD